MRRLTLLTILVLATVSPAQTNGFERLLVPIEITYQKHSEQRPWEKLEPGRRTATGVVVKGEHILIAAQAIRNATDITATRPDGSVVAATVVHIDNEINLALLDIPQAGFWKALRPARIAERVPTRGTVKAVFWNSRELDYSEHYSHGMIVREARENVNRSFFALDAVADAWSQPIFSTLFGRLVGIAVTSDDDYAYAIPAEILGRYVAMAEKPEEYKGFPGIDSLWQFNAHKPQATYLGSKPTGIVITRTPMGSTLAKGLQPRDVLLALDGHDIGTDGRYKDRKYGRLQFHAIAEAKSVGDVIEAEILRDGYKFIVNIKLTRWRSSRALIPWRRLEGPPPFAVRGGLVFRELDGNYLRSFGSSWKYSAPDYLAALYGREADRQSPERRRLVILANVLPDGYNIGYHNLSSHPVESVNGIPIDGINRLIEAFKKPRDGFHTITLAPGAERREIVLDAETFPEAQVRIIENYSIPIAERAATGAR